MERRNLGGVSRLIGRTDQTQTESEIVLLACYGTEEVGSPKRTANQSRHLLPLSTGRRPQSCTLGARRPPMDSPFLDVPEEEWLASNEHAFAIRDAYPVADGHTLIIPRRHIRTWWEATPEERAAILALLDEVKDLLDAAWMPDGYNVGFNAGTAAGQTVEHFHLHVIPRRRGDVGDPRGGIRWVLPERANYLRPVAPLRLLPGVPRGLGCDLVRCIEATEYDRIDLVVSFVMMSGLRVIQGPLQDALDRGAGVRVLTTDYMQVTEAAALAWLLDQADRGGAPGSLETRVFTAPEVSFHAKAYLFASSSADGGTCAEAFVGSSNLSRSGLVDGVEWNLATTDAGPMFTAFEGLWRDPRCVRLDRTWLADYAARQPPVKDRVEFQYVREPTPEGVAPLPLQEEALKALEASRADGFHAGLVVMATGLGKTWLAGFDAARPGAFRRILFVAHREEILRQSRDVFRLIHPRADLGLLLGGEKDPHARIVFAGVQTLARHVHKFAADAFDYVVIDEFHHAAARSYRKIIDHFAPKFLLGLTATPERMDGADLLALCGENLVFRCDLVEGIRRRYLCPFEYFGLKDVVDFRPIPWRNGKFDTRALTRAVETHHRAMQALNEWRKRGGRRTLAFCCTTTHADFMARFFAERGVKAVAVHSGPTSAPRHASIERLTAAELEVLFSVDIFNEGLDVPEIDTVLMLRPTESPIVFLQQLGRGLRVAKDKPRLTVIDFIGNHRSFLLKPRTLLSLGSSKAPTTAAVLKAVETSAFNLPEGCKVAYDLEVFDMLRAIARVDRRSALRDFCLTHHEEEGVRPSAAQALHAGYNPGSVRRKVGGWFHFLSELGLLSDEEDAALVAGGDLLAALEIEPITKSYKLVTLRALIHEGALLTGLPVGRLAEVSQQVVRKDPRLVRDTRNEELPDPAEASSRTWFRYWRKWPIAAWLGELKGTPGKWFRLDGGKFLPRFSVPPESAGAFSAMTAELVEFLTARYFARTPEAQEGMIRLKVSHSSGNPIVRFDRKRHPEIPHGPGIAFMADGQPYYGDFMKVALNVARRTGVKGNALPSLLRGWFGHDAGLPGTNHHVLLERADAAWVLRPDTPEAGIGAELSLPFFPDFRVACGAFDKPRRAAQTPMRRRLLLRGVESVPDQGAHFVAQARGDSMAGGEDPIRHGDFLLMRWASGVGRRDLVGQRVLVEYGRGRDAVVALKLLDRTASGQYLLRSAKPAHPPIEGGREMRLVAVLERRLSQGEINPLASTLHKEYSRRDVPPLYDDMFNVGKWNTGHVSLDGKAVLFVTLHKTKGMSEGSHYADRLEAPDILTWSSQSSTTQAGKKGREIIASMDTGTDIEVWLRRSKGGGFVYAGLAAFVEARGERPMSVTWRLLDPLPEEIYRRLSQQSGV